MEDKPTTQTAVNESDAAAQLTQSAEKEAVTGKADNKAKASRIWELDVLKCFAFFFMVFDHAMFSLRSIFKPMWQAQGKPDFMLDLCRFATGYRSSATVDTLRFFLCAGVFIFCCGISCTLSRNNLKRGLITAACAVSLTLVTFLSGLVFQTNLTITYGIICLLALCMLLGTLLVKLDYKILIVLSVIFFVSGRFFGTITVNDTVILPLFNFKSPFFKSADYYPLLPNLAFFTLGIAFAKLFYKNKKSLLPVRPNPATKAASLISKHLLILYFAHQIVIFGGFYLLGLIF